MPQCDVHFIEKCPICKPHLKAAPIQTVPQIQTTESASGQIIESVIHIPNAHPEPEITDPAAKNMLVLAQEYAKAQDEVTILRGMVKNLRSQLETAMENMRSHIASTEKELESAVWKCAEKQRLLADAVMPPAPPYKFPTTVTATAVRRHENKDEDSKDTEEPAKESAVPSR